MSEEAAFRVVESYYRREHFDFFRAYRNPFYAVSFPLRCTRLAAFAEGRGVSKYLALCYFFAKAMQPLEDFRFRLREGKIVLYDHLDLGLTLPAPGGRFRFGYRPYHPETETFFRRAEEQAAGEEVPEDGPFLVESDRPNYIYFTALPKVPFTNFTHVQGEPDRAEPQVAFGKFYRQGGELWVPVGLQVNHIFVDGAPIGELAEAAQRLYDEPV